MTKRFAIFIIVCLLLAMLPRAVSTADNGHISGDANGDGRVTAADAAVILRVADGIENLTSSYSALADVTGNMAIGRSDATAILLYCVGHILSFDELVTGGTDTLLGDRYLEKFSYRGTVRRGANYQSSHVSITVSTFTYGGAVCHLADIYIQHIESLRTAFSSGAFKGARETVAHMTEQTHALLAVNGDDYLRVTHGPLVRNGTWHRDTVQYDSDVCVLYYDGVMQTFAMGKADLESLQTRHVYQSWVCGPRLLDDAGNPMTRFNCPTNVTARAARTAIGYYEPGHYCLLVADGTQNIASSGMRLEDMSTLFYELGCKAAYNLFGGVNSLMCTDTGAVSTPHADSRPVSDILYIAEPGA